MCHWSQENVSSPITTSSLVLMPLPMCNQFCERVKLPPHSTTRLLNICITQKEQLHCLIILGVNTLNTFMHLIYIDFFLFNFSLYNGHFSPVVDKSLEMDWNEYSLRLIIINMWLFLLEAAKSPQRFYITQFKAAEGISTHLNELRIALAIFFNVSKSNTDENRFLHKQVL